MFAFPVIKFSSDGSYQFYQGMLHPLPPELTGNARFENYVRSKTEGWHLVEFGYSSYVIKNEMGELYIFPGLFPTDQKKPTKTFEGYTKKFTRKEIERYAKGIVERERNFRETIQTELNSFIHDLRKLSTAIYHQAYQARLTLPSNLKKTKEMLDTVIASQTMLKLRTDVLDVSGAPITDTHEKKIFVYKKVDKVAKCFKPIAQDRSVNINIEGRSHGQTYGPNVFEIICYIIIDNAIKYSPNDGEVNIQIIEEGKRIKIHFESVGPKVLESEINAIFTKGYRGKEAITSKVDGSGLGLHLAQSLINLFKGEIRFNVIEDYPVNGETQYSKHYFTIDVPVTNTST